MTNPTRQLAQELRHAANITPAHIHEAAATIDALLDAIEAGGAVAPRPTPSAPGSEALRQLRAWHAARRDQERDDALVQLHVRAVKALNVYFGPGEQL